MNSALRVAIVGCGRMGRERATAAVSLGANIVAVADSDATRAAALGSDHAGVNVVPDVADLPWHAIDAVFVCTPPSARGPVEAAAIRAGVPLFVEKPVGLSAGQLESVLAALEARPIVTAVGYMNRYRPSVTHARRMLNGRAPIGATCHWVCPPNPASWWRERRLSGGPLNEMATHLVDLARDLVGEVQDVHTIADDGCDIDGQATFAAALRFANGALGTLLYSCRATEKDIGFCVFAHERAVRLVGWDFDLVLPDQVIRGGVGASRNAIYAVEVEAFFSAIVNGRRTSIRSDFVDAVRTQCVVDAMLRSVARGGTTEVVIGPAAMVAG